MRFDIEGTRPRREPVRRRAAVAGLVLALLAGPGLIDVARAQITAGDLQDQAERVERELLRTRELMERVGPQVREASIPRAAELFERAVGLQTKARMRFEGTRSAPDDRELSEALQLTLQARELTLRAGQILRDQLSYEEKAQRAIERAGLLLERLREAAVGEDSRRVRVVLDEAQRQVEAAERHYRDRNFEIALRLAESALKLLASVPGGPEDPRTGVDRLRRELERTADLLHRAREHADVLPPAGAERLERAADLLDLAHRAFGAGELTRARRLNAECRSVLKSLLDEVGARVTAQDVERATRRFDADLKRLRDVAGESPPEAVQDLIDQALNARGAATEMAGRGEYERALGRLRAAFDMLARARRLLDARGR